MKVAVVGLYWKGHGGAIASATSYWPALLHWGIEPTFIVMSHRGRPKVSEPVQDSIPVTHVKFKDAAEFINSGGFELVHFWTMGETSDKEGKHLEILEEIDVPWMFTIRAPNDFKRYKFWEDMVLTGDFRGSGFISERLRRYAISKHPEYFNEDNTVATECTLLPDLVDIPDLSVKEKLVVQHSRLASIKRPHLTVEMAAELLVGGVDAVRIYGETGFYHYAEKLKAMDNYDLCEWPGKFELTDVGQVLRPAMFDVDFTQHGPHDGERPQNTTLEAMAYGAIPVLQDQWVCDEMQDMRNVIAVRDGHEAEDAIPKILEVLDHPTLFKEMVENNRKFVPLWFKKSKKLPEFYRRIVA